MTFNPLITTLKPQSNGSSYSNTVIGTLAVDGWAITSGTARKGGRSPYRPICLYWRPIGSRTWEPIIGPLKSKMAEIRHLENRHDVIFSAEGGLIGIKFRRLVQNDMSTAVMWSKWKPDVEFQYGGHLGEFNGMSSQSHVSHCRVLPLGEFTVTIPEPHAHCRVQSPDEINVTIVPHCRV